jgi:hypothetical protein
MLWLRALRFLLRSFSFACAQCIIYTLSLDSLDSLAKTRKSLRLTWLVFLLPASFHLTPYFSIFFEIKS